MNNQQEGMCQPLNDKDFFNLLTLNSKGVEDVKGIEIVIKFYPELKKYIKDDKE